MAGAAGGSTIAAACGRRSPCDEVADGDGDVLAAFASRPMPLPVPALRNRWPGGVRARSPRRRLSIADTTSASGFAAFMPGAGIAGPTAATGLWADGVGFGGGGGAASGRPCARVAGTPVGGVAIAVTFAPVDMLD